MAFEVNAQTNGTNFNISVPQKIIDDVGSVENLKKRVQITGVQNSVDRLILISQNGEGNMGDYLVSYNTDMNIMIIYSDIATQVRIATCIIENIKFIRYSLTIYFKMKKGVKLFTLSRAVFFLSLLKLMMLIV